MLRLCLSILALAIGPLVYRAIRTSSTLTRGIDVIVVVSVTGLVVMELGHNLLSDDVLIIIVGAALGLFGPTVVEHVLHRKDFHRIESWTHAATLTLAIAGVLVHAMLDGAALTEAVNGSGGSFLPAAVVLHRIPVGLLVWWLLRPTFGLPTAAGALCTIGIATAFGFWLGSDVLTDLPPVATLWLRALVAGSLLHVVFYRRHFDHA